MDRFYAPHTPEALAFQYLSENLFHWDAFDTEHSSLQERLMAGCAAYQALARYLAADDVYIPPRTRRDLERILTRYSIDGIHNLISTSRRALEDGGYARICHLAEVSIANVLDADDNAVTLLAIFAPTAEREHAHRRDKSPGQNIAIQ